jgi:hypothetical protein
MDPVAFDLIQRLLYIRGIYDAYLVTIGPGTKSVDLAYSLHYAQNPMDLIGEDADEAGEYVEKWSVCLTNGQTGWNSGWLALDTRKSKSFQNFISYLLVLDYLIRLSMGCENSERLPQ